MKIYISCSVIGLALLGKLTYSYIIYRNTKPVVETVNRVLFFPDKEFPCNKVVHGIVKNPPETRVCRNPSCRRLHGRDNESPSSLIQFLNYLASAKCTVDLCIYMFTQSILAEVLHDLHKTNVRVRIITDSSEDDAHTSQVDYLRKSGIEIKSNRRGTGALMHHKFVVVDGQLLLSGSFNWTNKAVVSNYEAVLVSSEKCLVEPFSEKFEEMWSQFGYHLKRNRIHQ